MLKRILFPSLVLYGFFVLIFIVTRLYKRPFVAPAVRPTTHSATPTITRTPPTPTIPLGKAVIEINGQIKKLSPRHYELSIIVVPHTASAVDAADFSLLVPLESVEVTKVAVGNLLPLCPRMEQEGNFYNVTCSTQETDTALDVSKKMTILTYSLLLREPYKNETVAINLTKTAFYHGGTSLPQYAGVTEFKLSEP